MHFVPWRVRSYPAPDAARVRLHLMPSSAGAVDAAFQMQMPFPADAFSGAALHKDNGTSERRLRLERRKGVGRQNTIEPGRCRECARDQSVHVGQRIIAYRHATVDEDITSFKSAVRNVRFPAKRDRSRWRG